MVKGPPLKLPRAPARSFAEPAQHAPLALHLTHKHSLTLIWGPSFYAGKMAAIEERVKSMSPDEAQAARIKAAKDARNRGA